MSFHRLLVAGCALALPIATSTQSRADGPNAPTSGRELASPPSVRVEPVPGAWLAAEVGRRRIYTYVRERSRKSEGRSVGELESFQGTLTEDTAAARGFGPDTVALVSSLRGRLGRALADTVETRRRILSIGGEGGVKVVADAGLDPLARPTALRRHDPPLELLPSTGDAWSIGATEHLGLRTEWVGEIVGLQDANTPAGIFEKCLVVRSTGTISGETEVDGAPLRIERGRIVRTDWFARGVGRVMSKTELDQRLRSGDDPVVAYAEREQLALTAILEPLETAPASPR